MSNIPTRKENPDGLHKRYIVKKRNRSPINPKAEYFVLRVDVYGSDIDYVNACRKAVMAYADAIEKHIPKLAAELRERYSQQLPF